METIKIIITAIFILAGVVVGFIASHMMLGLL